MAKRLPNRFDPFLPYDGVGEREIRRPAHQIASQIDYQKEAIKRLAASKVEELMVKTPVADLKQGMEKLICEILEGELIGNK